ncbi:MAG: HD domain-containing protein [Synergistetes bacterium]|nr:HD domain-containing protein [Synergistota bacterium]MDW8191454.1 HD domain-containing phosphohydrolase [Synergistota bacterium]
MKIVRVDELKGGELLGRSIYTPEGYSLLKRGVSLEKKHIDSIKRFSISHVAVFESEDEREIYEKSGDLLENPFLNKVREIYTGLRKNLSVFRKASFGIVSWEDSELILKRFDKAVQWERSKIAFFIELGRKITLALLREIFKGERKLISLGSFSYEDGGMLWEHWLNVAVLSMFTAFSLGYKVKRIWDIGTAALFHDIGKLFLSVEDFFLNSFLSKGEIDFTIAMHPLLGYGLLRNMRNLAISISHAVYQHHESFDGSGYPQGLERGEIIGQARIIGLCNYFDALLSGRLGFLPTVEEAVSRLEKLSEKLFDPKILDVFINDVIRKRML